MQLKSKRLVFNSRKIGKVNKRKLGKPNLFIGQIKGTKPRRVFAGQSKEINQVGQSLDELKEK